MKWPISGGIYNTAKNNMSVTIVSVKILQILGSIRTENVAFSHLTYNLSNVNLWKFRMGIKMGMKNKITNMSKIPLVPKIHDSCAQYKHQELKKWSVCYMGNSHTSNRDTR